jgi:hypothetical protein
MNDTTQKVEDRFHATPPSYKRIADNWPAAPKAPTTPLAMAYCPQGNQALEATKAGYKFTEDKNYHVLERKDYKIKVVDDSGTERWVKEDYFTLANQALMHDKDCGFTTKKPQDTLLWGGLELDPGVPDVRKVKLNKPEDDPQLVENKITLDRFSDNNTKALAGVDGKSYHDYQRTHEKTKLGPNQEFIDLKSPKTMNDIDKLWEKMGNVFPEYRKVNSDGLMDYIKSKFPSRGISWKCGVLMVDGCATNINKADVNAVFDGLKKLTTPKMADKLVGKVIVSKLKKLF